MIYQLPDAVYLIRGEGGEGLFQSRFLKQLLIILGGGGVCLNGDDKEERDNQGCHSPKRYGKRCELEFLSPIPPSPMTLAFKPGKPEDLEVKAKILAWGRYMKREGVGGKPSPPIPSPARD